MQINKEVKQVDVLYKNATYIVNCLLLLVFTTTHCCTKTKPLAISEYEIAANDAGTIL